MSAKPAPGFSIRHDLRPGDLGSIVHLHGTIYAREFGFDETFEAYVASPLSQFVVNRTERDRLWVAEYQGRVAGSIAIIGASQTQAQLRWFLVDPSARGIGLGSSLLLGAIEFSRAQGYESMFLWTVSALRAAAGLYRAAGFEKVEERPRRIWGVDVLEERYAMSLRPVTTR